MDIKEILNSIELPVIKREHYIVLAYAVAGLLRDGLTVKEIKLQVRRLVV